MLLDKVVFGLLIVLAGFVLDSILEHNRAEQALQNEIARVRVEKAAAVWGALDRQELLTAALPALFRASDCGFVRYVEFDRVRRKLSRGHAEFRRLLATNRFWLGDALHSELSAYGQRQTALVRFLQQKRRQRETLLYGILVNTSAMGGKRRRPPPIPWSARDLKEVVRLVGTARNREIRELACAQEFTHTESGLLGQIVRGLSRDRQDVAKVMERLVN